MGGEWPTVRLGNYVSSCLGKMLDKEKNRGDYYPYLGNKNVRWGNFDLEDLAQMRFEEHEHDRYSLKHGDLIVCEGGEPGRCAIWKNEVLNMKIQKALHRIRTCNGLHNVFLHYWFLWAGHTGALEPFFTGTTIKHLTGKALVDLQIPLPPIEEQKSIAHILGSLDDKIELNRQMNTTLESMAQALFKSWFVDFDPVIDNALAAGNPIPEPFQARAKTRKALGDQRKPLPEAIQQQFPNSFVFTEEMGWIPGGWSFARFSEAAHVVMGQSPAGDTYNSDGKGTPLVNGPVEFAEYFARKSKWTTAPSKCCNVGDLIVCVRGSTTGRYVKADGKYCLGRGVCAIQGKISQVFADQTYKANIDLLLLMTTGSTFPNWSGPTLNNFPIVLPPNHMLRLFEDQAGRIAQKIGSNCIQNDMLSQLRDTLLPKLLSGQLRIPDAEKLMADAL